MERRMSRRYDSMQLSKLSFYALDSIAAAKRMDSLKRLKKNKASKSPKKIEKKKTDIKSKKKQQKTQPSPPNDESRNENKPKSDYLLLFLVAIPVSAIAYVTRKI